jgi:pyrimidine operon attenuation protein/uracil phosphoribosyltransferase
LNELFDFGRPARIRLAVLVDRGGRQLPVQADFCAQHIDLPINRALVLNQDESGRLEFMLNASTH